MQINYGVTGEKRKQLVEAVSTTLNQKAVYLGMPTASYRVGDFTITKDGALIFDDSVPDETIENLKQVLDETGFTEKTGLVIEMPLDKVNPDILRKIVKAKATLIKHALGADSLDIEVGEDRVFFHWFDEIPEPEATKVYARFIVRLCQMSLKLKRASDHEVPVENEKYAFRTFLLRLGYIGDKYKNDRKILMQNLSGSASFKDKKDA